MNQQEHDLEWKIDTVNHSGQESFRIRNDLVTYVYHLEGSGFASLIDRDGNDWLSFGPAVGAFGLGRGIPNMARDIFGHPGYSFGASTTLEVVTPSHVRLVSRSADGCWQVRWDLDPRGAVQTIERTGGRYWWLYEGTPGGYFRPHQQFRLYAGGKSASCSSRDHRRGRGPRWVAFCDPATDRMILVAAHDNSPTIDCYRPMGGDGGMTVFGFGRDDRFRVFQRPLLRGAPRVFSFALIDGIDADRASARFAQLQAKTAANDNVHRT